MREPGISSGGSCDFLIAIDFCLIMHHADNMGGMLPARNTLALTFAKFSIFLHGYGFLVCFSIK